MAKPSAPRIITWLENRDWGLILLIGMGFGTAVSILALAGLIVWPGSPENPDFAAYRAAVAAAAVRQPVDQVPLHTVPPSQTEVVAVSFGPPQPLPEVNRSFDLWVSLDPDLRQLCAGSPDPLRTLQQALGLPPRPTSDYQIKELVVPRDGLFRPCPGGGDLATSQCGLDLPPLLAADAPAPALRAAYDQLYFLTNQMWTSYRDGFRRQTSLPGDYPYSGFPFTGMGWTYNWSATARNHVGVSEFVVRRDARIQTRKVMSPAEFCRGG